MDDADNNTEDGGVDQRSDSQEHHDINIDITDLPDPSEPREQAEEKGEIMEMEKNGINKKLGHSTTDDMDYGIFKRKGSVSGSVNETRSQDSK